MCHQEIGLVVPAKVMFLTDDWRCCETPKNKLTKRRNIFPTIHLKFKKKVFIENFSFKK